MFRRARVLFVALAVGLSGLALAACGPNPIHCRTSGNGGDNTRTQLAADRSPGIITAPGDHKTLDGAQGSDPNDGVTVVNDNIGSSTNAFSAVTLTGFGDMACIAHVAVTVAAGTNDNGYRVDPANFVVRNTDVTVNGTGAGIVQNGDDLTVSFAAIETHGGAGVSRAAGDNLTLSNVNIDSHASANVASIDGNWGTGGDHGLTLNKVNIYSAQKWFNIGSTPIGFTGETWLFTNADGPTATFLDGLGAYDPPSGLTLCDEVNIFWKPLTGRIADATLNKWRAKCNVVNFYVPNGGFSYPYPVCAPAGYCGAKSQYADI